LLIYLYYIAMTFDKKRLALCGAIIITACTALPGASTCYKQSGTCGFIHPARTTSIGGHAGCISGYIPVSVKKEGLNIALRLPNPPSQEAVTEIFLEYLQIDSTLKANVTSGGKLDVDETFDIHAQLCWPLKQHQQHNIEPRNKGKGARVNSTTDHNETPILQFLIHGIGSDKSYWNFAPGYSYIDTAAKSGFATFSFDRLGTGRSTHPNPIQTVQAPLEVYIAHKLIHLLRRGSLCNQSFQKIVGVGHSFGSIQIAGLAAEYGTDDLDAIVLTGFSTSASGIPLFLAAADWSIASRNRPSRFGRLDNGYLVTDTIAGNQFGFFRYPNFDPKILAQDDARKETFTLGELFTLTLPVKSAPKFTGPLFVINGERDLVFCQSNCKLPFDQAVAVQPALFPAVHSGKSATLLVKGTGHAPNLHLTRQKTFAAINSWVGRAFSP
jgi:pimeloyl-ACP methyl ester carboxylesterase